jgi:hypothetical protein
MLIVCGLAVLAFSATAGAAVDRPFKGYMVGEFFITPDPASPSPLDLWSDMWAAGAVSHLGASVLTGRHPTPIGDDVTGGTHTLVAANGDEIWMTYSIQDMVSPVPGVPSVIGGAVDVVITGGTGRFAHASGTGQIIGAIQFPGEFNLEPWPGVWTWSFRIRY